MARGLCLLLPAVLLIGGCAISKRVTYAEPAAPSVPGVEGSVRLRVALDQRLPRQHFTCTGPFRLVSDELNHPVLQLEAGDSVSAWCGQAGLMFAGGLPGGPVAGLTLEPVNAGDFMIWDGRRWRGSLQVNACAADGAGLTVVNVVELEDYLGGVVPLEIGRGRPKSDRAAVEAQAVAARTYAVMRLGGHGDRGFDLYADTRDQVYGGVDVEDPAATAAIVTTSGLVLRGGGELAATFFHANCGGHTAAKEAVWPVAPDPLLRGVPDQRPDGRPWCADGRGSQWRQQWTWAELTEVLGRSLPAYLRYLSSPARAAWAGDAFSPSVAGADGGDPGALHDLQVAERSRDGRVAVLEVVTAAGIYRVRGGRIRWVLRAPRGKSTLLRSTWFDLTVDGGKGVTAVGRGHGHGLGLCQDGAVARARAGQSARAILEHYYPGGRLARLGAGDLP